MGKRKIRNFLINPPLQLRIAIECAIAALLIALLSGGMVFISVWSVMTEITPGGLIPYHRTLLFIGLALGMIGLACVIAALSIVVTHRIAGPIYKIEKHLAAILNEEPVTELRLRRGDTFHELARLINQIVEKLNAHL